MDAEIKLINNIILETYKNCISTNSKYNINEENLLGAIFHWLHNKNMYDYTITKNNICGIEVWQITHKIEKES